MPGVNRSAVSLLTLTLSLLAAAGCGDPVTQIVVVVDTDLMVPDEVDTIRIATYRASADVVEQFDFAIYPIDASALPLTVGVLLPPQLQDENGDPLPADELDVAIEVTATGASDRNRVSTRVNTTFVDGLSLEVPIFVGQNCRRVTCPLGQSCGMNGCVPIAELTPPQMVYGGDLEGLVTLPPDPAPGE